jgi:hypothetical protein
MNIVANLPAVKPALTQANGASAVDARGLLHRRATQAVKACAAADLVDGFTHLQHPTQRVAAAAYGVSMASAARACCLTVEERDQVRNGERPLVLPAPVPKPVPTTVPATPPTPPTTTINAEQRLLESLDELGLDAVLLLLVDREQRAWSLRSSQSKHRCRPLLGLSGTAAVGGIK